MGLLELIFLIIIQTILIVPWVLILLGGLIIGYILKETLAGYPNHYKTYKISMWVIISISVIAFAFEVMTRLFSHRSLGFFTRYYYNSFLFIAVIVVIAAIIKVIKVREEFVEKQWLINHTFFGVLVIISCILFSNSSLAGWITPSSFSDTPRYTADGHFIYHIEFNQTGNQWYHVYLVAKNIHTEETNSLYLQGTSSRNTDDIPWAVLTPTDEPYIYLLVLTQSHLGSHPEFEIDFLCGNVFFQETQTIESSAVGAFNYTSDGRLKYRLEQALLLRRSMRSPLIRIFIKNLETSKEHSIALFTTVLPRTEEYTLRDTIILEPTDTNDVYIVSFCNMYDVFYVNLAENTSERIEQYFYGPWKTTEDSLIEYRIQISNLHIYSTVNRPPSAQLQVRYLQTQHEMSVELIVNLDTVRRHILDGSDLDWVIMKPSQTTNIYYAKLRIPPTGPDYRSHNLNADIEINVLTGVSQVTRVPY